MPNKFTPDDLTSHLNTSGWRLRDDRPDKIVTGTLSEVLTESHSRKTKSESPGKIEQIETAVELDLFQMELLWHQLGLPTI
jgi:hypothetical protein